MGASRQSTEYHKQAVTLDPAVEIPDDAFQAQAHDDELSGRVQEAAEEHREAVKAEAEAQAKADAERDERLASGEGPKPSELLRERGHEPTPDEDDDKDDNGKSKSKKATRKKDDS